jgi:hypothetical protein
MLMAPPPSPEGEGEPEHEGDEVDEGELVVEGEMVTDGEAVADGWITSSAYTAPARLRPSASTKRDPTNAVPLDPATATLEPK